MLLQVLVQFCLHKCWYFSIRTDKWR